MENNNDKFSRSENLEQKLEPNYSITDFVRNTFSNSLYHAFKEDVRQTYARASKGESGWKPVKAVYSLIEKPTKKFLKWIFEPREWERKNDAEFYRKLGVKRFKGLYKRKEDVIENLAKDIFYFDWPRIEEVRANGIGELEKYETLTKFYEAACWKITEHTIFPGTPLIYYEFGIKGLALTALAWFPAIGFPIMIQRMNRVRIHNLLDKMKNKMEERKNDEQ
ncbi:hypothetical protein HZA97_06540 [Candidatus Woesearchaeota archaeon]|nr:hypothetical protein [Candidatus Woesearchaeota archaeon]